MTRTTETQYDDVKALRRIADNLLEWAKARNFEGFDPYDALNSPFANFLTLGTRYGRIALTQALRRSPINLRPILRVKAGANPKAFALFLEGSVALGQHQVARRLVERLLALRSHRSEHVAWGYNFPWQNRFQLLPAHTPTIVNTSFAAHALLDYVDARGENNDELRHDALNAAVDACRFIVEELNRLDDGNDACCFSYTPEDKNFVHNANLLGASLLARVAVKHDKIEFLELALAALRYSMRRQHDDGSWFYAERQEQRWIDSFHTGFNLEAIRRFIALGLAKEYHAQYTSGVRYYANRFFLEDATPKYYADRVYLVDVHAPAEAIYFFAKEPRYEELTRRIIRWMMENLYDQKTGLFWFRKAKFYTVKIPYLRWTQAWAFRALSAAIASTPSVERVTD